jgi:hypothetical protein
MKVSEQCLCFKILIKGKKKTCRLNPALLFNQGSNARGILRLGRKKPSPSTQQNHNRHNRHNPKHTVRVLNLQHRWVTQQPEVQHHMILLMVPDSPETKRKGQTSL